jgi:hypothetical protein
MVRTVDIWTFLNQNSGSVVAITATASAIITVLLLLEARTTRNLRREASVVAYPRSHAPVYVELMMENAGPAHARDVRIEFKFIDEAGDVQGPVRVQVDPLLAPGSFHRFLPSPAESLQTLHQLADWKLRLSVKWSWRDDRRRFWFFAQKHEREATWPAADLRDGFYGGWALIEPNGAADLNDISRAVLKMQQQLADWIRDQSRTARTASRQPAATTRTTMPAPKDVREWLRRFLTGAD